MLRSTLALAILPFASCAQPTIAPGHYSVDVEFTVGTDGKTTDAKVIKSNAPQPLQQAALEEIKRYRAEPSADPSRGRRTIEFNVEPEGAAR